MKKKLAVAGFGFLLLILCSPVSNAGFRDPGPCYGYGCPALWSNNKPYQAKVNKDGNSDENTATAKSDAKPAAGQQTTAPANTKQ